MNRLNPCLAILMFAVGYLTTDAQPYPNDFFSAPVDREILLSGTFGELRPGHFHAGIDVKSLNGKPGEEILSAAGGYISRIAVSPGGYGNALYIAHPNGYTTVYAHLDRFIPEVAAYVKKKQYELRQFKVNLYPKPNQFTVQKGELIGYLGNSGSSFGPHLHFEVRRTSDQVPVNPFHFGFEVDDDLPPEILALRMYYLDADHNVFHSEDFEAVEVSSGKYTLNESPVTAGAWRVAFSVKTHDRMNGVPNRNGSYLHDIRVDSISQFTFRMDAVSFSESRYINAHIDYAAAADDLGRMHRFFKLPGNKLNFYDSGPDKGYVQLFESKPRQVAIHVSDFNGNSSVLEFAVLRDTEMKPPSAPTGQFCDENTSLAIQTEGFRFDVPSGAVYTKTYFEYTREEGGTDGWFGPMHTIGSKHIPLHKYSEISIQSTDVPSKLASKAFIALLPEDETDEINSIGGSMVNGWITAATRSCGTYGIRLDTVKPTITPVDFGPDMQGKPYMRFEIGDNVETSGRAKGLSYTAKVNGKWILMEYDAKNDRLTHWFDERIGPGTHLLRITVTDDRNNITTFEGRFTR